MNKLREARIQKHLGLRETARELGCSPAHLCDIEHSRRSPSNDLLRKIEAMFGDVGIIEERAANMVQHMFPAFRKEDKESIARRLAASERKAINRKR